MSDLASRHRPARIGRDLFPRRQGVEYDGGAHRIRQRDLVQGLDSLFLLLETIEHQLPLGRIEVDSRDFLRAGDGIDSDVRAGGELRPEYAGEEGRAEADAREVAHEMASIQGRTHAHNSSSLRVLSICN
jgi:hypothetical protein